ncbi:hypothetical protein FHW69_002497 [Luteibacter sp. Sphag1AF]|uniref:DUF2884 family protein n=1 Tax=Luteibacter sp. Sphag1AF TaxID=2587031 RepID=UPI001607A4AF|nr:DUF2884 family protein [Luteibacter sp. Sphag1AF]MBB3227865.1 hypothetical protein [Luteibacter sp. Sphag1AF]
MHRSLIACTIAAVIVAAAAPVTARTINISTSKCSYDYSTPFDVDVARDGITFHQEDGTPRKVFIHDGALRVDGRDVSVSAADAEALRKYEDGVRQLMPIAASIAHEALDLGFAAMTTVTTSFAVGDERTHVLDKLNRKHAEALREVDATLGQGHWQAKRAKNLIEDSVGDTVGELVGTVTANAVSAALSGDSTKMAALQERADSLDKSLNRAMDVRSKRLDADTDNVCPRLNDLAALQKSWHIKLSDGSGLQLMTIRPKTENDKSQSRVASE